MCNNNEIELKYLLDEEWNDLTQIIAVNSD